MSSFQEINELIPTGAETFAFSESDAEGILFPATSFTGTSSLSAEELKLKLTHLKKKEIRAKLHGSTLSEYWRSKRIPQGLRIQKPPTIGKENEEFNQKWCEILNKCSMDLMLLIIKEVTKQKEDIEKEIEKHEIFMKEKLGDDYTHTCDSIKQTLRDFEEDLMTTKLKKYRRDANDYQTGRVYKWMYGEERKRDLPQRPHRQRFNFSSESDFPSDSDSYHSSHHSQPRQPPKNDQKNKGKKPQGNGRGQGQRGQGGDRGNEEARGTVTRQQSRVRS